MNQAITGTNVVLNLAISPSLWLKNTKPANNNKFKIATHDMVLGVNGNINYSGIMNKQKRFIRSYDINIWNLLISNHKIKTNRTS